MPPRVSVVMPVHNGERYLDEAIASVLSQTFADFELIVVDDASSDGTADIIAEYARRDSRLQPVYQARNQGAAAARNRGMCLAGGEFIAAMDSDDICLPERLKTQVTYLDAHPQVGVVGSDVFFVGDDLTFRYQARHPQRHALILWALFFSPYFCHPTCMIRRQLLEGAGGYAESLRTAEDVDLWARLAGTTRFANLPDITLLYRRHPQADGVGNRQAQHAMFAQIQKRLLQRLWSGVPADTIARFLRVLRKETSFRRAERHLLRADLTRLIAALIEAGWVTEGERPLLNAALENVMRQVRPRRRQFWKRLC